MLSFLVGEHELSISPETTCTESPDSKSPGAQDPSLLSSLCCLGVVPCVLRVGLVKHPPVGAVYVAAPVSQECLSGVAVSPGVCYSVEIVSYK